MSKQPITNVSNSVETAIALSGASSESTVDGQLTKAIAIMTAYTAVDSVDSANATAALAILQARQAHVHNPSGKGG